MACMEFEMGKVSNVSEVASAVTVPGQGGEMQIFIKSH